MESSGTRQGYGEAARTPRGVRPRARDTLALLSAEFDEGHDVWRSAMGTVCVAGPDSARAVLGNRDAMVVEASDFYKTRHGDFDPVRRRSGSGARPVP